MGLSGIDIATFVGFIALVIGISLYASRKEQSSEDYFLAGRGLTWWLIGFSLIASNISTEHFVGMGGEGFDMGLAIASFEWIAAIALVFVALVLLPRFLHLGIYTLPEYLEHRYGPAARGLMAAYLLAAYVLVFMAGVLYTGAKALETIFEIDLYLGVWAIGLLAGAYTIYGGLKAVVWSDLLQGAALLGGGLLVMVLGFREVGGVEAFVQASQAKLHTVLPADHPVMPWTIFLLGIWIPNLAYWGLNQFITQRALGARSLRHGQRGILFAAGLKLLIPFVVVFPGIMAFQLYGAEIPHKDQAYPFLMSKILPAGLRGVMFAALFGAIMSSLDSVLNSASTILTIDLYKRHLARREPSQKRLVGIGRIATGGFVVFACICAPFFEHMGGIYKAMQVGWNAIWPGILSVFVLGLVWKRASQRAAVIAMAVSVPAYVLFYLLLDVVFLNAAALAFLLACAAIAVCSLIWPRTEFRTLPESGAVDMRPDPAARVCAALIVAATLGLYLFFW
ncbi:MAG: solute:sodium symporter family transporter [Deltaproteobacteria bacterium]|nr:solute:sodium symporter family transporter [Deltaproteobacteria bacterium]